MIRIGDRVKTAEADYVGVVESIDEKQGRRRMWVRWHRGYACWVPEAKLTLVSAAA